MRIVKPRAGLGCELIPTLGFEALIKPAGGDTPLDHCAKPLTVATAGSDAFLDRDLRNSTVTALGASDAFWPTFLLQVSYTGFLGREFNSNSYRIHARSMTD